MGSMVLWYGLFELNHLHTLNELFYVYKPILVKEVGGHYLLGLRRRVS